MNSIHNYIRTKVNSSLIVLTYVFLSVIVLYRAKLFLRQREALLFLTSLSHVFDVVFYDNSLNKSVKEDIILYLGVLA